MRYFFIIHYFSWKHAGFRYLLKTKYCIIACSDLELEGLAINMQIHQTKKHKGFDIHVGLHVNKVFWREEYLIHEWCRPRLAYVVSLTGALYSQWGLRPLNVKYCVCLDTPQFLYQLTHRHPLIAYGVFPQWSHKYLYGKTSNFYTYIILLAVGLPACTSLPPNAGNTGCWSPSMHLSPAQWRILQRSELYQFKTLP